MLKHTLKIHKLVVGRENIYLYIYVYIDYCHFICRHGVKCKTGGRCSLCNNEYKSDMKRHMASVHPKSNDKCVCNLCGKKAYLLILKIGPGGPKFHFKQIDMGTKFDKFYKVTKKRPETFLTSQMRQV